MRRTINQQLQIGRATNPIGASSYSRGLLTSMPQLQVEDWDLDFHNDMRSINSYSNAIGTYGIAYPICLPTNTKCKYCVAKCRGEGKKWLKGGKACYNACVASYIEAKQEMKGKPVQAGQDMGQQEEAPETFDPSLAEEPNKKAGMSTGALIGVTLGGLAVLGTVGYLIFRKKS